MVVRGFSEAFVDALLFRVAQDADAFGCLVVNPAFGDRHRHRRPFGELYVAQEPFPADGSWSSR